MGHPPALNGTEIHCGPPDGYARVADGWCPDGTGMGNRIAPSCRRCGHAIDLAPLGPGIGSITRSIRNAPTCRIAANCRPRSIRMRGGGTRVWALRLASGSSSCATRVAGVLAGRLTGRAVRIRIWTAARLHRFGLAQRMAVLDDRPVGPHVCSAC